MSNSPTLPPAAGLQRKPTPVPGLATEGDARLQAALAASARAEASLNGLFRAIQSLGNGVGGAREANESLTLELEALRDMLGAANEQHRAFKQKVALLEQTLDRARREADRDRTFLIDQQDTFIAKLMDEQEAELKRRDSDLETLRGRVAELEQRREPGEAAATATAVAAAVASLAATRAQGSQPSLAPSSQVTEIERAERAELERTAQKLAEDREHARATVHRLQAQRDEAQSAVRRISNERDEALQQVHRLKAELGGPRISTRPPSADTRPDSTPFRIPPQSGNHLTLEHLEMEARLIRPTSPSQPEMPQLSASQQTLPAPSASDSGSAPISSAKSPAISSVLRPPRSNPLAAPIPTRLSPPPSRLSPPPPAPSFSPPPEELRRALTNPPSSATWSSRPALKQKPDASTRPLVGYSLNEDSVEAEHLEGVRLSNKPPSSGSSPPRSLK